MKRIIVAKSFELIAELLRATVVLVAEASDARRTHGKAKALHANGVGAHREDGIAVIWGDDSVETASEIRSAPDPVVVVGVPGPIRKGGPVARAIRGVIAEGRQGFAFDLLEEAREVVVHQSEGGGYTEVLTLATKGKG